MMRFLVLMWLLPIMVAVCGCGDGTSGGGAGGGGSGGAGGGAPMADAGADQTVDEGATVELDGSGSSDPAGGSLTYAWSQVSGPLVTLSDANSVSPTFVAPEAAIKTTAQVELMLTVTDPDGATSSDNVEIAARSTDYAVFIADAATTGLIELFKYDAETDAVSKLSGPSAFGGVQVESFANSPDRKWVAFQTKQGVFPDIVTALFVVASDGSQLNRVSGEAAGFSSGFVSSYAWAPDSSRVAFLGVLSATDTSPELYTVATGEDFTMQQNVNSAGIGEVVGSFAWAPDASRIAFWIDGTLYAAAPTGGGRTELSSPILLQLVTDYAWAPDSSRVAYLADLLITVLPDGSERTLVSFGGNPNAEVIDFQWSPDSRRVAYLGDIDTDDAFELFTDDPESGDRRTVNAPLAPGQSIRGFSWAPDSSRLAYYAGNVLYTGNPPSAATTAVGSGVGGSFLLVGKPFEWSPDSAWVAYGAVRGGASVNEMYVTSANIDTSRKVSGPDVPSRDAQFPLAQQVWSPNSMRVLYRSDEVQALALDLFSALRNESESDLLSEPPMNNVNSFTSAGLWSPDGSRVLYVALQDTPASGTANLWIQTADGEEDPVAAYAAPASSVGVFQQAATWAGQPVPPEIVYAPAGGGPL